MTDTLPAGFLVRAPTMDDLEAVTALANACEVADYGTAETTLELVRTSWLSPGIDLQANNWLVISPQSHVVAHADMHDRGQTRIYAAIRVLPEYRDSGIVAYLLHRVEERVRSYIPAAPMDARITLNIWTAHVNTSIRRLLEQAGYALIRSSWDMEIDMDKAPARPQWPDCVSVRTLIPGQDERAVFETDEEAFQDHWGHVPTKFEEWEHWMVKRENFDPGLWFLAYDGDQLAGISLCENEKDAGWVDTLAVRRPWRRKGLGMALLLHSFGEFYRRGKRKVGLNVDSQNLTGATRLYERAGMHVVRQYDTYQKELRPGIELSTQVITL